ncbi:hypothetical protein SAMN05421753_10428 [Planctomicrobium piriforme]|uniref:Uncharacterized protein n=1 Tax=Planctomicrobium piriforme TaxID=1576369 RepID=A0A1I3E0L0_9PLAN|nr:hypothetical protein SAMN05421753_10428 [Planctomicrobium piriforme]
MSSRKKLRLVKPKNQKSAIGQPDTPEIHFAAKLGELVGRHLGKLLRDSGQRFSADLPKRSSNSHFT